MQAVGAWSGRAYRSFPSSPRTPLPKKESIDRNAHRELRDAGARLAVFAAGAALAMVAAALVAEAAGLEALRRVTDHVGLPWLALCFAGQLVGMLGYTLALRNVARMEGGPVLGLGLSARTVLAGFGVYGASHASGGFAVDYWVLRQAGLSRGQAVARIVALAALEWALLAPAALAAAVALLAGAGHVQGGMTWPWLAVAPGFLIAVWLSSPKRSSGLADPKGGGRLRSALAHLVAGVVILRSMATRPWQHGPGLLGVGLYYLGDLASLWAALHALSVSLSLPALILAYATGYAASRRSLPAGGAGVVEALMTFALVWVGVGLAPALAGVLLYRLFNFWLPMLPALLVLPSGARLRREYRQAGSLQAD
jgi:hypothetical protein